MSGTIENTTKLLRQRAQATRRFAQICVFSIVVIVAAMIIFFYVGTDLILPSLRVTKSNEIVASNASIPPEVERRINELSEEIGRIHDNLDFHKSYQGYQLATTISRIAVRIASVFLSVYLIQILVGITRYHFRLADHLDTSAAALEISTGSRELAQIWAVLSTGQIQFGKAPVAPQEVTLDVIKELINKIPTMKT